MTTTEHTPRTAADWAALADSYDQEAARNRQKAADSFDRCDTDGFLSQWASGMTARLLAAKADWARNLGKVTVPVLTDTDGVIISTHSKEGQWGQFWILTDEAAERFGRRFVSLSKAKTYARKAAANRRKGFVEAQAEVDGYVKITGSGTGLSGCATAGVGNFPDIDALKAHDVKIVDPDFLMTLSATWDDKD